MTFLKSAILLSAAIMAVTNGAPAEGAGNSDNRGAVHNLLGTGWGSSGNGNTAGITKAAAVKSSSLHETSRGRTQVPEPSNLLMLGLGVVGLIVGRMIAKRRQKT
ncbi:MAG: PEP-CTERM sorting domain-containing protein [Parasphingorhabdus sp.]